MAEPEKTALLDEEMREVFDWSDDETPVRDALWNHFMDTNAHSTDKTEDSMKEIDAMSDDEVKAYVNANLK